MVYLHSYYTQGIFQRSGGGGGGGGGGGRVQEGLVYLCVQKLLPWYIVCYCMPTLAMLVCLNICKKSPLSYCSYMGRQSIV